MDKSAGGGIEVILVEKTSVRNEIRFNEASNEVYFSNYTTSPLGNSPNSTAMDIEGGSLHGLIFVRSETDPHGGAGSQAIGPLAKIREDLDTLAVQLATEVSTIYDTPGDNEFFFDDDENPDAIDLSAITAGNIRLYPGDPLGDFGPVITPLNSTTLKATNTTNTGANEVALALAELRDNISSNLRGNTFGEFISEMATDLGYEVSSTENLLENQSLLNSQLQDQRASVSGVSIDEELANIIRFQKSFEASARVLQVMDEMLEVIVSLAR